MFKKIIALLVVFLCIAGCHNKTKEELLSEGTKLLDENPKGAIVLLRNALEKDQNFCEARFQLARAYAISGKNQQAEKEFQKVLRQDPNNVEVHKGLARVYVNTNQPEDALREAQLYLQSKPGDAEVLELEGRGYALKNEFKDAEKYLLEALGTDPDRLSAKLGLAFVYSAQGNTKDAKTLLEEVIKKDNKNTRAYYMLAKIEASSANREAEINIYKKIAEINPSDPNALYQIGFSQMQMGEMKKSDEMAERLMKQFPKRPEGYRLKGYVYFYEKKFSDAIGVFQTSVRMRPAPGSYYVLGLSYYNIGELEQALSQFQKALDFNPSFIQARLMTSTVLLAQKRTDDAIQESRKALQIDDKNALAHNILGSAYMAKGMYAEAMAELNKATELDPNLIGAHLKKGNLYIVKGKSSEAETEFKTAVQISPKLLNTRLLLFGYYMKLKEYDKAMKTAREGITGEKADAVMYNNMALASFLAKNKNSESEALQYLRKAKEVNPDYFAAYFNAASYYGAIGQYEKALGEYKAVLMRDPKNVNALLKAAVTLELRGKNEEALTYYKKAKETKQPGGFTALANYYIRKKDSAQALKILDEAVKADPSNIYAFEMQGGIYLGEKKYTEAVRAFEGIEKINPDRGMDLLVNTYLAMHEYDKALNKLERRLIAGPQRLDLMAEIASVNLVKGDAKKAVDSAYKIIYQKPDSAYGYMILGSIYVKQKEFDKARDTLKKGSQVEEKNSDVRMMLADLYAKQKDYTLAIKTYEDIIKGKQDYVPALFAQGSIYDFMGRKKEAARTYQKILAISENNVPALNNLAFLRANGFGNKKEALKLAGRAFDLAPEKGEVVDTLGYALLMNGRLEDATKAFERAVSLLPDNPSIRYHLALAYKQNGNAGKAKEQLVLALAKNDFPEVVSAKKLLEGVQGK